MSGNSLEALCRDFEEDSLLEPGSEGSSNGDIHDETLLDAPSPEEGGKLTDGTKDEILKDESDLDGTANTSESVAEQTVVENPAFESSTANSQPEAAKDKDADDDDDGDEALALIDAFLQDSAPLRAQMFTESEFTSSTPKSRRAKSRIGSETEELWKEVDKQTGGEASPSTSSDETRPVIQPVSQALVPDEPGPQSQQPPETSEPISINLPRYDVVQKDKYGNDLDVSLLDWDDDEDIEETTIDEILDLDDAILDDTDEEEEEDVEGGGANTTVIAAETVDQDRPVLLPPSPQKPALKRHQPKISTSEIKNIDKIYYKELCHIFDMYKEFDNMPPKPSFDQIRRPRIFHVTGKIVGYESLEEFIDNNHPLWESYRSTMRDCLEDRINGKRMADFIHKEWNSGLNIDLNQNLTSFPRKNFKQPTLEALTEAAAASAGSSNLAAQLNNETKQNKAKLLDMVRGAGDNEGVRQREKERFRLYTEYKSSTAAQLATPAEAAVDTELVEDCGYCFRACLCSPGRPPKHGNKRKRKGSKDGELPVTKKRPPIPFHQEDYEMAVLKRLDRKEAERGAKIVKAIRESYDFRRCYTQETWCDKQMVRELNSMEAIYDDFKEYYTSPYERHKPPKETPKEKEATSGTSHPLEDY